MSVIVTKNMPINVAIGKWKKQIEADGLIKQLRAREYYQKPSIAKRNKSMEARKLKAKNDRKSKHKAGESK